ncbi:MAG: hypothetical protein J6A75_11715 [Lachnospiraceae bacterium]|nr:hypothetical protein [Lachnospiraceae bacterium]
MGFNTDEMMFDPMTGEPIKKETGGEGMVFDPMTGQPTNPLMGNEMRFDMNKKTPGKIFIIIGVIVAVIAVVLTGIFSGAFLNKRTKVLVAAAKTFKDESHLMRDFGDIAKILRKDECMVAITTDGNVEGIPMNVTASCAKNKKKVQLSAEVNATGAKVDFTAEINDKNLAVCVPSVSDQKFIYDYTGDNDGYIIQVLEDEGIDAEMLNQSLQAIASGGKQSEWVKKLTKAISKEYKSLKFKKLDTKEFKVDGKKRKCKGYSTEITSDNMENVLAAVEDLLVEEYEDMLDMMNLDVDNFIRELEDTIDLMSDIEVCFYISGGKLACIQAEVNGAEVELTFLGGNTRTENMELEVDGMTVFEIEGSDKSGVEETKLSVMGTQVASVEYKYKEHTFEIEAGNEYAGCNIAGILDSNRNGVTLKADEFEVVGENIDIEFEAVVSKDAKFVELEGEEFDIGNASENDFEDIAEEIQKANLSF